MYRPPGQLLFGTQASGTTQWRKPWKCLRRRNSSSACVPLCRLWLPGWDWALHWALLLHPRSASRLTDLVNRMSQLLTKHEYAINSLKQDSTVYFFVKPGPQGCCRISSAPQRNWRSGTRQRGPQSASLIFLPDFILQSMLVLDVDHDIASLSSGWMFLATTTTSST